MPLRGIKGQGREREEGREEGGRELGLLPPASRGS